MEKAFDAENVLRLLFEYREVDLACLQYEVSRSLNYESFLEKHLVSIPREHVIHLLAPEADVFFVSVAKKIEDLEHLQIKVCRAKSEYDELKAQVDI